MCAGMLVHIPRHLSRTSSNNNKMLINNLLCCFAIQVVYIQITIMIRISLFGLFLWRTYSWSRNMDCTAGFSVFAFIGFYFEFLFYYYIIYIHLALPLVYYPIGLLLLSYYTMYVSCLRSQLYISSLIVSLPARVRQCSRHGFQYMLIIQIY